MKLKRIVEISFVIVASAAVLTQATMIFLGWREGRIVQSEIRKGAHVSVARINPAFPPALLLEFENSSRRTIREIHFQLVCENSGQVVARADRDYGEVKPGEKKKILLECVSTLSSQSAPGPMTRLKYRLLVFPNSRKALPEISGDLEIQ